ncbi:hypothetical protein ACHHYP_09225 [Achlya hypogyna]|uniref:Uncharacterized protein n=1 Tax=Achlya hypogyna TaxID=1202772 RepID=A0A1V9YNM7_ACHHY|nr:hypothetical protein ACHHYP_09225 [Achlya hypogyna]
MRAPSLSRKAVELAVLVHYLDYIPPTNSRWERRLVENLVHPRWSPVAPFGPVVYGLSSTASPIEATMAVAVLAHVLAPNNVAQYRALIATHGACVLAKTQLEEAYHSGVELVYAIADEFLHQQFQASIASLAVRIQNQHPHVDASVRARVAIEGRVGARAVVALFREVALGGQQLAPPSDTRTEDPSPLTGIWKLCPEASCATHANLAVPVSMGGIARWASWVFCCSVELQGDRLLVASQWQLYEAPPSEFVLDNTPRVLRTFPNGESTMSGTGRVLDGDYVGRIASHGEVRIECYRYHLTAQYSSRLVLDIVCRDKHLVCTFTHHHLDGPIADELVLAAVADRRAAVWDSSFSHVVADGSAVFMRVDEDAL